ncbi:MAG: ABC transporter ATP-binding protein [Sarcina sp.]
MEFIKLNGVSKIYGHGASSVNALKDINLEFKKGEFVAIVGTSGSGKSTLLHIIGGVDKLTSGEVIIDGIKINEMKEHELAVLRRRKIGFVFQFFNLIPVLNVIDNIEMPILLDKKQIDDDYINELLKLLKLNEKKEALPHELSGGQQQRVAIARALANKPEIILADEPTGNLDSKAAKDVIELLKYSTKKYNQTLILITHDLEIASIADRIVTICDGGVIREEDE